MQQSFKRDIRSLDEIFEFLDRQITSRSADEAPAYVLRLAVEELFTNMVKYNRGGDPEIGIGVEINGRAFTVTLTDCGGEPFDMTRAKEVDTLRPLEERPIGGLGIHLVRQMVDELRYSYSGRCGTITVVKYRELPHVRDHRQG